jgi:hypothetical protein
MRVCVLWWPAIEPRNACMREKVLREKVEGDVVEGEGVD